MGENNAKSKDFPMGLSFLNVIERRGEPIRNTCQYEWELAPFYSS
jgi:hypothetical protein